MAAVRRQMTAPRGMCPTYPLLHGHRYWSFLVSRTAAGESYDRRGGNMRENRLRTLLNEDKPTFGTRVQSSWPTIIEMVGRSGNFDYVEFLAEYAPYDLYALDNMARAIELSPDFTGLIKIERSAQAHIAVRAMAAGIQNVLFTDVRSKQDAEDCVRIVKPEVPGSVGTHGNDAGRAAIGGVPELIKRYEDSVV